MPDKSMGGIATPGDEGVGFRRILDPCDAVEYEPNAVITDRNGNEIFSADSLFFRGHNPEASDDDQSWAGEIRLSTSNREGSNFMKFNDYIAEETIVVDEKGKESVGVVLERGWKTLEGKRLTFEQETIKSTTEGMSDARPWFLRRIEPSTGGAGFTPGEGD